MDTKLTSLENLLEEQIADLYSAEEQLIEAMPKMMEKANDKALKEAIKMHFEETKKQKERLEKVCDKLGYKKGGEKCKAMAGLIKEAEEFMKKDASEEVMDAGIIASAQRIEHYEIAGYGTAHHFAKVLKHTEAADLLEQTLKEEKHADEKLNSVAMKGVNKEAMQQ